MRKTEARWTSRDEWRIDVQNNGQRKSFYSSTKGRKGKIECERKADDWLENNADALANPRLVDLWADYLKEVQRTTSEANYIKTEQLGRLYLLPDLSNKRIASITLQHWQNRITAAGEKGLSKKTCENIRGAITALYRYARKNRVDMERPELLAIPRNAPVGQRKILQPDQLKKLFQIDWITHWGKKEQCYYIHAWRFIVLTGLRRGELCGLQWEDIHDSVLHVSRSITSKQTITQGKNENARRYIALSGRMRAEIDAQRALLKQHGIISPWVFPSPDGSVMDTNSLYKQWYSYRQQHGIESSIHELRHTMISIVKSDIPETLLKQVVGHSKAMDTGIYQHIVDGDAERASTIIDNVFDRLLK